VLLGLRSAAASGAARPIVARYHHYTTDGVNPDLATPGSTFTFKVKYQHPDGTAPKFVRLFLYGPDGKLVAGKMYPMSKEGDVDYKAGVVFTKQMALPAHGRYTYYFTASDGTTTVRLPATGRVTGPVVDAAPVLAWTGATVFLADGVNPDSRKVAGTFVFSVSTPTRRATPRPTSGPACGVRAGRNWRAALQNGPTRRHRRLEDNRCELRRARGAG